MYNKSEKISASEINKFTYCPYQWYYERKFGKGTIVERYKKAKKSGGSRESNFERGNRFHAQFHKNYKAAGVVKLLIAVLVTIVAFMVIRWMM